MPRSLAISFIFILIISGFSSCSSDRQVVDGYTDRVSYFPGDTVQVFINAGKEISDFDLNLYDINEELLQSFKANVFPQKMRTDKPYQSGFGYIMSYSYVVPESMKSGVYTFATQIPFIVKQRKAARIVVLYNSNTENAYSESGGESLYSYYEDIKEHQPIVSFQRPIRIADYEKGFLRWINTQQEYEVSYVCDLDMDEYQNIEDAELFIIAGHSEYWTRKARRNFDRFIANGKNALIMSGNTMWWQVRYSADQSQMICYRKAALDSAIDSMKTITWPDPLLNYSTRASVGADFNYGGFGSEEDNGWDGFKIVNPESSVFKGMEVSKNDVLPLETIEYDGAPLLFNADSTEVILDNDLDFYKYELIGYDWASRRPNSNGVWLMMQAKKNSGVIINAATTDWCSKRGIEGESEDEIRIITTNMIDLLLEKDSEASFRGLNE